MTASPMVVRSARDDGSGVRAGRLVIARLPQLAAHQGMPPDLLLRWNAMPQIGRAHV